MTLNVGDRVETPCREWRGARTAAGYGNAYIGGVRWYLHRWVWTQVHGPIAPGIEVMHKCDNPPCFRYDHLVAGTHADNMRDMFAKGRNTNYNSKKVRCPKCGGPYTFKPRGDRIRRKCRNCENIAQRIRRAK